MKIGTVKTDLNDFGSVTGWLVCVLVVDYYAQISVVRIVLETTGFKDRSAFFGKK